MTMLDKIDKYLDNELQGEELLAFKQQLETDEQLASQVKLHQEVNESITDDEVYYLRQKLSILINKNTTRHFYVKFTSGIAAGILVLLSAIIITKSPGPEKAYEQFYSPYSIDLTTRSSNSVLDGLDFAIKLYAEGEYDTALQILKSYNKETFHDTNAKYYLGLCALEAEEYSLAEKSFEEILKEGNYAYSLHARWYLSMLYLKTDQPEKALPLLKELSDSENYYAERSRKILRKYLKKS